MILVGATSADHPIRVFIMDDALTAVLRYYQGESIDNGYHYEEVRTGFHDAETAKKTMTWEELFDAAIELGDEVEIIACGLALDVLGKSEDDLPDIFSFVSGVADFVGNLSENDIVFTM